MTAPTRRKPGKRNSIDVIGRTYCRADMTMAERVTFVGTTLTAAGCHEWNGSRSDVQYPLISIRRKTRAVHRWVLEQKLGRPLLPGEVCRHRCDNPPCINPDHLEVGSPRDNTQDAVVRGRHRHGDGAPGIPRPARRKWGDDVVQRIQTMRSQGASVQQIAQSTGASRSFIYSLSNGSSTRLPTSKESA